MKRAPAKTKKLPARTSYAGLVSGIGHLLEAARHATVRVTNSLMTATYWEVGRRIVEFEQGGKRRAEYGDELLERLGNDLSRRCGKGFSRFNLARFRTFYLAYPAEKIRATLSLESSGAEARAIRATLSLESGPAVGSTVSGKSAVVPVFQTSSEKFGSVKAAALERIFALRDFATAFPLPWSTYVRLLSVKSEAARDFYHTEALGGGWSVRQLDRQIGSLFYERTALSRNKAAMLSKAAQPQPGDTLSLEEAVRDPLVLEFLNLRDEYSETDLENALIRHLETFLIELGGDFAFVGRQRRLRVDDEWYRVDLIFFHRRLRCLVIIDLKLGKLTHADAGQMHLYLNYAREHWTRDGENPPVGLILCSSAGENLVRYSLDNLPSKVLAREYRLALPPEKLLAKELQQARRAAELNGIFARPRKAKQRTSSRI